MTPNRPYLLRALFDWICDNDCTPYLLVDATLEGVDVPMEHVEDGRIVLNASGTAVANFEISDEAVSFNTRFSGRDTWINVPMAAVLAISARETQQGMTFSPDEYPRPGRTADEAGDNSAESNASDASEASDTSGSTDAPRKPADGSHLKVIK